MDTLLDIVGLTKVFRHPWTFRQLPALTDLSLAAREGEILGLIGPNGAGKTTTFKLLLGLIRPTRGHATFLGRPASSTWARRHIGFLPEQPYFYDYLSVRETLEFYAELNGLARTERRQAIAALAQRLSLVPTLDTPMRSLSKGTLQRVGIAQAIAHRPRLVILDEPMSGLDPAGRKEMRDLIRALKDDGTTILFSSHILPDAEALCDRVAILVGGRLREVVDLAHLEPDGGERFALAVSGLADGGIEALARLACEPISVGPSVCTVTICDRAHANQAIRVIHNHGGCLESLTPIRPSLEHRLLAHVTTTDSAR